MKQVPPAHKSGTAGQIVNPIPHNIHVDAGPLTAQIADYYDQREHANTSQRGKLAAQLEREARLYKAPESIVATLDAPTTQERAYRLKKALLGACTFAEDSAIPGCGEPALSTELIRKIISENT